jgi:hypothetical protein
MSSMRRNLLAAVCITAVLAVAGCADAKQGVPQGVSTPQSTKSTSKAPSTSGSSTAPASTLEPCSLLSPSEASGLGLGAGKSSQVADRKTCNWPGSGAGGVLIGLGKVALDQLNGQSVEVGKKHPAAKLPPTEYGGCSIALGLTGLSDVLNATVVAVPAPGQSNESACPKAMDVAKIIDPKLP